MVKQKETLHAWGNLSCLTSALLWAKYGYWSKGHDPPEWYDKELKIAERVVCITQPPDTQYKITFTSETPGAYTGKFQIWDLANPWIEPWEINFLYFTRERAISDYQQRYCELKSLHDGVINALIHYRNTGEPIEVDWMPRSGTNYHWLQKDYNPNDYKGFRRLKRAKKEPAHDTM